MKHHKKGAVSPAQDLVLQDLEQGWDDGKAIKPAHYVLPAARKEADQHDAHQGARWRFLLLLVLLGALPILVVVLDTWHVVPLGKGSIEVGASTIRIKGEGGAVEVRNTDDWCKVMVGEGGTGTVCKRFSDARSASYIAIAACWLAAVWYAVMVAYRNARSMLVFVPILLELVYGRESVC